MEKKTGGFDFITQQIRESCLLDFITAAKHVLICFWEHLMYFKADVWFRNNEILLLLLLFIYPFFFPLSKNTISVISFAARSNVRKEMILISFTLQRLCSVFQNTLRFE